MRVSSREGEQDAVTNETDACNRMRTLASASTDGMPPSMPDCAREMQRQRPLVPKKHEHPPQQRARRVCAPVSRRMRPAAARNTQAGVQCAVSTVRQARKRKDMRSPDQQAKAPVPSLAAPPPSPAQGRM